MAMIVAASTSEEDFDETLQVLKKAAVARSVNLRASKYRQDEECAKYDKKTEEEFAH